MLILALTTIRAQSSIIGKWRWHATGGAQEIILDFKVNGSRVTGTITMIQASLQKSSEGGFFLDADTPFDDLRAIFFPPVTFPIVDGQLSANTVTFSQESHTLTQGFQFGAAARQPRVEKLFYRGEIDGDRIRFTRSYRATPGNPWIVGAHRVSFVVERVK